jgi:hypothetical protein
MPNMNIKTLQNVLDKLFRSGGKAICHGKYAYRMDKNEYATWVSWMPCDEYKKDFERFNNSPVGWYALIRIA